MRIKVLRNLPLKPGRPEGEQRYEGREYDVSTKEGATLIAAGLAVDLGPPRAAAAPPEAEEEGGDGLDGLKFMQLKEIATAEGITLVAKSRVDALAEIRAARAAVAQAGDEAGGGTGGDGEDQDETTG